MTCPNTGCTRQPVSSCELDTTLATLSHSSEIPTCSLPTLHPSVSIYLSENRQPPPVLLLMEWYWVEGEQFSHSEAVLSPNALNLCGGDDGGASVKATDGAQTCHTCLHLSSYRAVKVRPSGQNRPGSPGRPLCQLTCYLSFDPQTY